MQRGFGSDNHSGVHPELLGAIQRANIDHAPSYGTDLWSEKADLQFKNHFGKQAQTFFVFNGTAANCLATSAMIESFESIFVTDVSHMQMDECGAPEFFSGGKLHPLPHREGKLSLLDLKNALIRRGDQHYSQARAIGLTQPTEVGTLYTLNEIREICAWAKTQGLFVHMDGARIANAIHGLGCTFQQMTTELGVDVVSFGGTKNGFLFGEAVVFLNPALAENFKYRRKQAAQLPSKTRFIAAQFEHYLSTDLWQRLAKHSCEMAELLFQGLKKLPHLEITQTRQSNAVFVKIPQKWIKILREHTFFYVWDEHSFECRLMTSWDTQREDIQFFLQQIETLCSERTS